MSRRATPVDQLPRSLDDIDHDALKIPEVASIMRVSPEYVQRQCRAGHIPARKLGKEWRVHRDTVRDLLAGAGITPTDRPARRNSRQKRSP